PATVCHAPLKMIAILSPTIETSGTLRAVVDAPELEGFVPVCQTGILNSGSPTAFALNPPPLNDAAVSDAHWPPFVLSSVAPTLDVFGSSVGGNAPASFVSS